MCVVCILSLIYSVFHFQHFIPKDGVKWNYLCILSSLRTVVANNMILVNLVKRLICPWKKFAFTHIFIAISEGSCVTHMQ